MKITDVPLEELEETPNKSQKSHSFKIWESIRMGKHPKRVLAHFKKPHITQNPRQFLLGKPRAEKSASSLRNFALFILIEPPYTEPYVRWCERSGVNHSLLLDCYCIEYFQRLGYCEKFLRGRGGPLRHGKDSLR